jgi:hypothetical protein
MLRRTPLRPVSPRRRAAEPARRRCIAAVRKRSQGFCEGRVAGVCTGTATDVHEILLRSQGGSVTDPANCLDLCRACHSYAHAHPAIACELGLIQRRNG